MKFSLRTGLICVAVLSAWFAWRANNLRDMNVPELMDNCRAALVSSYDVEQSGSKIVDLKILAMYRMHDERPVHVDYALCGARISRGDNESFVLVRMARNPINARERDKTWGIAFNTGWNNWMHFFESKPTVQDIDDKMCFLDESDNWDIYTKRLFRRNWDEFVVGDPPERFTK
jgi:hypothetical protein